MKDDESREGQAQGKGRKPKYVRITDYLDPEELDKAPDAPTGTKVGDIVSAIEALTPQQREEMEALSRQISENIQARLMEALPMTKVFSVEGLFPSISERFQPVRGLDLNALLGIPGLSSSVAAQGSFARAARELSKIPPHVLRDAHLMRQARAYLAETYPIFLEAISKPGPWSDYKPFDWSASSLQDLDTDPAERESTPPIVGALEALAEQVVATWLDLFAEVAPTVAEVIEQDIYNVADAVVQEWRELYDMPLTEDVSEAAAAENTPPVRSTDKLSQNLLRVTRVRERGDEGPTNGPLQGVSQGPRLPGKPGYDLQLWYHGTEIDHLGGLHKLTADAIGSLWLGSGTDTSEKLPLTLTQITRQVMGTPSRNTPTDTQEREVQRCIEDLMEITGLVRNIVDYDGKVPEVNGQPLEGYRGKIAPADVAYLRTHKGNLVTGYIFFRLPLTFILSQAYGYAKEVAALLAPRKGGWTPSKIRQAVIQDYLATRIVTFQGSQFKAGDEREISYEKIQEYVGGEYAPEVIKPHHRTRFRNEVDVALKEFQARGAIAAYDIYKVRQRFAGVKVILPQERTELALHPEDTRRLQARKARG